MLILFLKPFQLLQLIYAHSAILLAPAIIRLFNNADLHFLRELRAGMAANDPANAQYQLWIIDPDRDARPVDGGVFDVPAGAAEVIVTIDAKLAIARPTAFAVTLEKPGGVVVSDGPLLIVAPAG